MALYAYRAFTKEGKKTKGVIEALSEQEAKDKIRHLQLLLVDLKEEFKKRAIKQLKSDQLVIFTSQLAQLVAAKIPLYESLLALEEQARQEPYHPIILAVGERIKAGASLSKAMQDFPASFPTLYRALIQAGEAVGNLELTLTRLASLLAHQRKITKQLVNQLTYPLFLVGLMLVVIMILIGFVLPSLETLFENRNLPLLTTCLFMISQSVRENALWLFIGISCGITALITQYQKQGFREKLQRFVLKLPLIRRIIVHSQLARFGRTLATLLEGGLPLPNALQFATNALRNVKLQEILHHVTIRVIEGKTISEELGRYKEIPTLFTRMLKIGEESGKLVPMLNQVATIYEEETERTMQRLITLSQPLLLVIMGIIIGTVILSILLPLSDFGSHLQL